MSTEKETRGAEGTGEALGAVRESIPEMASRESPESYAGIARREGDNIEIPAEEPRETTGFGETDHSSEWPEASRMGGLRGQLQASSKDGEGHRNLSMQSLVGQIKEFRLHLEGSREP